MNATQAQVLELVFAEPAGADDPPSAKGWLQRMSRAAVRHLPASGVGFSLLNSGGSRMRVAASDAVSLGLEELQFTKGEGPCLAAYTARAPVLVPDLSEAANTRWMAYGPAALELGVRAVFAFPMTVGSARLGALDAYRTEPGQLSETAQTQAMAFAVTATQHLLETAAQAEEAETLLSDAAEHTDEIHQAQGMAMVQLSLSAEDALARMRAQAFLAEMRLIEVARAILAGRIVLADGDMR